VVLPKEEDQQTIHQLVQRAIEKQFKVSAAIESKPADVYVMTAIKGRHRLQRPVMRVLEAGLQPHPDLSFHSPKEQCLRPKQ
jgi:hypothetical protein